MPTRKLKVVDNPDDGGVAVPQRNPARPKSLTTSFRIPAFWFDKVQAEADRLRISASQIYLRALTLYFDSFQSMSWETTEEDFYNPNQFYTQSEDKKGHSFHLRVNIPKPVAGELTGLIQSGAVPQYRSVADFARDAIYHRAKQISRMVEDGELEQVVDMAMLLSEEMQIADEATHAEQLIEQVRANAQMMWAKGSKTRLKQYLASRLEVADSLAEPYRSDYLAMLRDYERRISRRERGRARTEDD